MKYIIVIDKQSRNNPSGEAREYVFEIDELLRKGDISDDLIVERGKAKHIKRIELSEYGVTNVLSKEIVSELGDYVLKLFEGDNYIYVKDEYNNVLKAEYVIKNQFTDLYVTDLQMKSAIEESADQITLSVEKVLTGYSTTEETKTMLKLLSDEISLEVSTKVDEDKIISKINMTPETIKILAKLIQLEGLVTVNKAFKITEEGTMECIGAIINGCTIANGDNFKLDAEGNITLQGENSIPRLKILSPDGSMILNLSCGSLRYIKNGSIAVGIDGQIGIISCKTNGIDTTISGGYIRVGNETGNNSLVYPTYMQSKEFKNVSLEELKKNIEKLENGLDIVKNSEIYVYNFKEEADTDKKHVGFVIGEKYKTPELAKSTGGDAIDNYSMTSILWGAFQEYIREEENKRRKLEQRIEKLEGQANG